MKFFQQKKSDDPFAALSAKRHGPTKKELKYNLKYDEELVGSGGKAKLGRSFNFSKIFRIKLFFAVFLLLLFGRLYYLQGVRGEYYEDLSNGNRIRETRLEAKRGIIYDRDLNVLVSNVANFMLYFIPVDLPEEGEARDKLFDELKLVLGDLKIEQVKQDLKNIQKGSWESFQPYVVADNIEYEKSMRLYLTVDDIPGVVLQGRSRRQYNLPTLSYSHLLGYTGKISARELENYGDQYSMIDYVGKSGLEYFYESVLKGVNGFKQVEVDALGREKRVISQQQIQDGNNLVLTIDSAAQVFLESALREHLKEYELTKASAIAMDPRNGEIISLVSLPSYNNNMFARGISSEEYKHLAEHPDKPLFFRAVSGEYPSGSTIKPIMLLGALSDGLVTPNTQVMSTGGLRISQWFFPDWKAGGHGWTNARKAIAESVNTYFYYIGGGYKDFPGLGIDKIKRFYEVLGLGSQTGVDLPNEADGFVPSPEWKEEYKGERWYIGDTYHTAIGQGDLLVTPLQVAYFTGFFANKGSLYRPHLVKYILASDDNMISSGDNTPVKQNLYSPSHIEVVREGMRQAVTYGSAVRLNTLPVEAAGKTGTAQWSTKQEPHAWFTGFAPYDDPELVVVVMIEQGEEGSRTAVPVAYDFLQWYFGEHKPRE